MLVQVETHMSWNGTSVLPHLPESGSLEGPRSVRAPTLVLLDLGEQGAAGATRLMSLCNSEAAAVHTRCSGAGTSDSGDPWVDRS